jgi:hypothetical protein
MPALSIRTAAPSGGGVMRMSRVWGTSLFAAAVLPAAASAQVASSVVGRTEMHAPAHGEGWRGWSALGAALSLDRARYGLSAEAEALTDGDAWNGRGSFGGLLLAPALGPLQLSVTGDLTRSGPRGHSSAWSAAAQARASLRAGPWGLWTGLDARHAGDADSVGERATPVIGGWRQLGPAILSVQLAPRRFRVDGTASTIREELRTDSIFNDTLGRYEEYQHYVTVGDSGRAARTLRWDQAEARLFWAYGRLAADATLGGRVGRDFGDALWAAVSALYVLTPRVVLVAGAGSRPGEPASLWQRRTFATLGVRLLGPPEPGYRAPPEIRPDAAAFQLRPTREGRYAVTIRVPNARTVELSGDFTDWKPVPLSRIAPDRWEAVLSIAPGTHYVNVRVNGDRWMAPPGVPEVEDEFNGTVGLLVVS